MSTPDIDARQLMGQRNGDDNGDVFAATGTGCQRRWWFRAVKRMKTRESAIKYS